MSVKNSSNAGKNQQSQRGKNEKTVAAQFKKGYDPRRNMKGRPKSFDQLRALGQDIGEQIATLKDGTPILWNGQEITFAEFILLAWATDKKQMDKFIEYAYGKVPQPIMGTGTDGKIELVVTYANDPDRKPPETP